MKTQTSLLAALLLLGAASAWSAPVPAATPAPTASPSAAPSADSRLFGSPARLDTVTRTIDVTPGTRRVLVGSGESVAIRAGGQTVGWTFLQAIGGSSMKLALLMPGVPQAKDVYVQIAPSEIYSGG